MFVFAPRTFVAAAGLAVLLLPSMAEAQVVSRGVGGGF